MTVFSNPSLRKLQNSRLLVEVARATDKEARRLVAAGEIPSYYLHPEIYEPGTEHSFASDRSYYEISRYGDGFGASLFIIGPEMLLLSSNHEDASDQAYEGDRTDYLAPLIVGAPSTWEQIFNRLVDDERFEMNPPTGVFWFRNGEWHITDLYDRIKRDNSDQQLASYRSGVDGVEETDLSYLFAHAGETSVNAAAIDLYFDDWRL